MSVQMVLKLLGLGGFILGDASSDNDKGGYVRIRVTVGAGQGVALSQGVPSKGAAGKDNAGKRVNGMGSQEVPAQPGLGAVGTVSSFTLSNSLKLGDNKVASGLDTNKGVSTSNYFHPLSVDHDGINDTDILDVFLSPPHM
jgi:hypothetical protein